MVQKGAGVQAKLADAHVGAEGCHLGHIVVIVSLGYPQVTPQLEVKGEDQIMGRALPVLSEPFLHRAGDPTDHPVQTGAGFLFKEGAVFRLVALAAQLHKFIVQLAQGSFQLAFALAQRLAGLQHLTFQKASRVHFPGPVRQIVSLVHQKQIVAAAFKKALQADHRVEQIVVIPHNHIAPEREVQPQLEGADGEPPGQILQRGAGELVFVQRLPQRIPDAVVVAVGVGAGLRGTFSNRQMVSLAVRVMLFSARSGWLLRSRASASSAACRVVVRAVR